MESNTSNSCLTWISELANDIWVWLITVLNSNFSIALVGSLAGAFAGAVAAHQIIDRNKRRELFLNELRNTNAAIMVGFSICNIALRLKKQHALPLQKKFNQDLAELQSFNAIKGDVEI